MNIEYRLDPRRELDDRPFRERPPWRAFLGAVLFLVLLLLWWYFTRPATPVSPIGNGSGPGSTLSGDGPGAGDRGNGPGSGDRGGGPGSGEHGDRTGAAEHGETGRTGKAESASRPAHPDGTGKAASDTGSTAANTPAQTPAAAPEPSAMAKQLEAYDRSAAHPLQTIQPPPASGGTRQRGTAAGPSGSSGGSGYRGFYGLKVSTRGKVLFLVDMSGSMGGPRMATLKQELKKALGLDQSGKRPPLGSFMIIGFNTQTVKFPENGMARYRNGKEMAEAAEFIDRQLQAGGGTYMTPAWQEALREAKANQITAIYFLTDGEGELTAASLLALLERAEVGSLKVNCVAIGPDQPYMREVATKRQGSYVHHP